MTRATGGTSPHLSTPHPHLIRTPFPFPCRARDALKAQKGEMEAITKAIEGEKQEKEQLEAKIKAMESKVLQVWASLIPL